jgi:ABC-type Fe3+ transport system permease subunit
VTDWGVAEVTLWSAGRSALVAVFAAAAGYVIAAELWRASQPARGILWVLLVGTLLAPDLVAGYGYRNFSLSLARHTAWNEAFLTLLIGLKAATVAAVVVRFSPEPPLTPAGRHALRLATGRIGFADRLRIAARGEFARTLPAFAVASLFAFQQFELPSLTGGMAWTVTLFDRQALLPDLAESADPLVWPLVIEILLLGPVVALVVRSVASNRRSVPPARRSTTVRAAAWSVIIAAALLAAVLPFAMLVWEGTAGLGYVAQQTPNAVSYWREVATALGFGVPAGIVAYAGGSALLRLVWSRGGGAPGVILLALACVPGLCGPLVPSLFAVELFQSSALLPLRDTLVPLVAVLSLFLLPRAVLIEALSRLMRDGTAIHLAKGLRSSPEWTQRVAGRRLLWELDGFGRFCRVSLLAYWGYLDLTAAAILAPPDVVPVTARLYNLMHYGHNAALSAMTLVTAAVPALLFVALLAARHLSLRLLAR